MPKLKMGEIIARYNCRPLKTRDLFTLILPGILAVLLPLGVGYQRVQLAETRYGPAAATVWGQRWYSIALVGLAAFVILASYRLWLSHRSVTVYQRGLHINLYKPLTLRWENLAGVRVAAIRRRFMFFDYGIRYTAWLIPTTGRSLKLPTDLHKLPELLTQIKAHLYPRLAKEMKAEFALGKRLYFGPISIHQDGLSYLPSPNRKNGKYSPIHPWTKLLRLSIENGVLVLEFDDCKPKHFMVADIPNIELLHEIIQRDIPSPT